MNIKYYLIIITVFSVLSCTADLKFNADTWKQKGVDWQIRKEREQMVNDLIASDTLIGLSKTEVISLLGNPDQIKDDKIKYLIREKYSWNIDPEYIKYLWIVLDDNEIATTCFIEKTR